ncbi:MAG: ABC transporter permease, partial [Lysobacteraceae bacterium]
MKKTWIFFKLRLLQLKSDKTALFFSYVLPVLLLLGIGLPLEVRDGTVLDVSYRDDARTAQSAALIETLSKRPYVKMKAYAGDPDVARERIANNDAKHFLQIGRSSDGGLEYRLFSNSLVENQVENAALRGEIDALLDGRPASGLRSEQLSSKKITSYIVTLLPGIIGMTLLLIGLNGFGGVLIEEEHHGLYKNIKTIDVSPVPFLAGLFASRMLVAYSVAVAMFAIGVFVFDVPWDVDYALLLLVVTLGALSFHGIGLAISALSPSVNAFYGIVNFVQIPLIVLGGVFFSIESF